MLLDRETVDGEIHIRDGHTDNHDIVAIVPLTGDKEDTTYDDEILSPWADQIVDLPRMVQTLEAIANDCDRIMTGEYDDTMAVIQSIHLAACAFSKHFPPNPATAPQ